MNGNHKLIRFLFVVAALWDGLLGLIFMFWGAAMYERFGVAPPNHYGYVHFPAALLIVFGILFWAVASHPVRNRNLIPFGILLKVSYCGVVGYHWAAGGIPNMWKPFAIVDLVFMVLFIMAYGALGKAVDREGAPA